MKARIIILLSSALVLASVAPSWSQNEPSPAASPAAAAAVSRDGYLQSVKLRMAGWRVKLADLGARASDATTAAGKGAKTDISEAWARVELAADRLDAAGAGGWLDAKAAYERAAEDLDAAWAEFRPAKT